MLHDIAAHGIRVSVEEYSLQTASNCEYGRDAARMRLDVQLCNYVGMTTLPSESSKNGRMYVAEDQH